MLFVGLLLREANRDAAKQDASEYSGLHFLQNDERMHHYQRGRASITGLMVELREIIETGRLVVVVMSRLVLLLVLGGRQGGLVSRPPPRDHLR